MKKIKLVEDEITEIKDLASGRADPKTDRNLESQRVWGNSARDDDILGLMGEKAVAKFLNSSIFKWTSLTGDEGADVIIDDYIKVEVRTGRKRGYRFALGSTDFSEFKADIGVLAWKLSDNLIGLPGWTTKAHFIFNAQVIDFGYGKRLALEPDDLLDIKKLIDLKDKIT